MTQHSSLLTLISVLKLYKMHPKHQQGPRSVYQCFPIEVVFRGCTISLLLHFGSSLPLWLPLFPHPILILILKCPLPFPPPLLVYLWEKLKLDPYLPVLRISGEVQEQPFASFPGLVEQKKTLLSLFLLHSWSKGIYISFMVW